MLLLLIQCEVKADLLGWQTFLIIAGLKFDGTADIGFGGCFQPDLLNEFHLPRILVGRNTQLFIGIQLHFTYFFGFSVERHQGVFIEKNCGWVDDGVLGLSLRVEMPVRLNRGEHAHFVGFSVDLPG